jgi:hypothetical protein
MTGSGISRSDLIKVAIMPNKNAKVMGETRFSSRTSTGIFGSSFVGAAPLLSLSPPEGET